MEKPSADAQGAGRSNFVNIITETTKKSIKNSNKCYGKGCDLSVTTTIVPIRTRHNRDVTVNK